MEKWAEYADMLRLSDEDLVSLLALRNQRPDGGSAADREVGGESGATRLWRRIRIHGALWIPAEIREVGGATRLMRVYPVDISAGGMCILLGMFVHEGTAFRLTIRTGESDMLEVGGKAVRCVHLKGRVHEVGVSFDERFDLALLQRDLPASAIAPDSAVPAAADSPVSADPTGAARAKAANEPARDLSPMADELDTLADQLDVINSISARMRVISGSLRIRDSARG